MKLKMILGLFALFTVSANAAPLFERTLDPSVLAQVVISGGLVAPGAVSTSVYSVKTNGDVELARYRRGDLTPPTQAVELVGKLNADDQALLERSMSDVQPGKLVDLDPNGPTGADAPDVSYDINRDGKALTVALRRGDFHTFALQQQAALTIKKLLDKAISR